MTASISAGRDEPLPILLSVPHGGRECPAELAASSRLLEHDLFEDSDSFTDSIYDAGDHVAHIEVARIARAYVDLNRAPDDLPPQNPDGVVKSTTDHNVPIYGAGEEPELALIARLLSRYHQPYHDRLTAAAADPGVAIGIDCHSMEPFPPPIAPDAGRERPVFCLSNAKGETAPQETLEALGDALSSAFGVDRYRVAHNDPFGGGWIARSHARTDGIPWIQLEMNRSLYLGPRWFDERRLRVDETRIRELNAMFVEALELFAAQLTST